MKDADASRARGREGRAHRIRSPDRCVDRQDYLPIAIHVMNGCGWGKTHYTRMARMVICTP